jgi:hypothetical protein
MYICFILGGMSNRLEKLKAALKGTYEIERELGAGGMATVYLARDGKHNLRDCHG